MKCHKDEEENKNVRKNRYVYCFRMSKEETKNLVQQVNVGSIDYFSCPTIRSLRLVRVRVYIFFMCCSL